MNHPTAASAREPFRRAHPRRMAVAPLLVAACALSLTAPASAVVRLMEFSAGCTGSNPSAAFVELVNSTQAITLDARVGLAVYDHNDALLLDVRPLYGYFVGATWNPGQSFLFANTEFGNVAHLGPNSTAAFAPDSAQGRLLLYSLAADNVTRTTIDQLAYGGVGQPPAPAPGSSVQRTGAAQTAWTAVAAPNPKNFDGFTTLGPFCAPPPPPTPRLRVSEFATRCADRGAGGAFVELENWNVDFVVPNGLFGLRVRDHSGQLLGDLPDLFGPFWGLTMANSQVFLVAPTDYIGAEGQGRNAVLPATPDTLGGAFIVYLRNATGGETVIDSLQYGSAAVPAPAPGQSTQRNSTTGTYLRRGTPGPEGWGHSNMIRTGCHYEALTALRVQEFAIACGDGSSAGRFVDVTPILPTGGRCRMDDRLRLRIVDSTGTTTSETPLFANALDWTASRHVLIASTEFASATGLVPDVVSGISLGRRGTLDLVETVDENPANARLVSRLQYGLPGTHPSPPDGQSLRWDGLPVTAYALDPFPQPERSDGRVPPVTACFPRLDTLHVRLDEVFVQCRNGNAESPFLEFVATAPTRFTSALRLRVRDHADTLTYDGPLPLGTRTDTPWATGQRFLLSLLAAEPVTGADASLGVPLDPVGGRVTLAIAGSLEARVIDECSWGTLGTNAPAGMSLQWSGEQWVVSNPPTPTNAAGAPSDVSGGCFGQCPLSYVTIYPDIIRAPLAAAIVDTTRNGARAGYDLPRGRMHAASTTTGVETIAVDGYVLTGPPAGTAVPLTLHLPTRADVLTGECPVPPCWLISNASLNAALDAPGTAHDVQRSFPALSDAERTIPIHVVAGEPFELRLALQATPQYPGGRVDAGVVWWFEGLPPGATLSSCQGWTNSTAGAPTPTAPTRFALRGVRPNPGRADVVSFAIDRAGDVRVEVIDIAGRRVLEHRWEALGPGEHTRALARPGELRPGVYLVRLSHGGRTASTRAIVMP